MLDEIRKAAADFDATLSRATSLHALDELRVRYFGRKGGLIPSLFTQLKDVAREQKKEVGDALNKLRDRLEAELKEKSDRVAAEEAARREAREQLDGTLPARLPRLGHLHPTTIVRRAMAQIFPELGYSIDPRPETETAW